MMIMSASMMALIVKAQVNSDTVDLSAYQTQAVNYTCGSND